MYRLGEVERNHRKVYVTLAIIIGIAIVVAVSASRFFKPDTKISNASAAVTRTISYDPTNLATVNEPLFSLKLPTTWKLTTDNNQAPTPDYLWQGTTKDDNSRWIAIYVDRTDLASFPLNRELYVQASDNTLNILSDVSDNCTTFTGAASGQGHATTPAKWQGIDFLCDTGNYERDVVGTASPDGLNTVLLTGTTMGKHHFFFTYTDNSPSPDYSFFTNALKSFVVK